MYTALQSFLILEQSCGATLSKFLFKKLTKPSDIRQDVFFKFYLIEWAIITNISEVLQCGRIKFLNYIFNCFFAFIEVFTVMLCTVFRSGYVTVPVIFLPYVKYLK
jgi:hypothetical protein